MKIRNPFTILRGAARCHPEVRVRRTSLEGSTGGAPQDDMFCMLFMFLGFWALVLVACTPVSSNLRTITLKSPVGQTVSFHVEIADSPEERAQGLMFREELSEGQGMLFVFEEERPLSFWMKNTLIPLDIIFFDRKGRMVSWTTMEPCTVDPCPSYPSRGPAQFALEVPFGTVERKGITEGWLLGSF